MGRVRDFFIPIIDQPSKGELKEENERRKKNIEKIKQHQFEASEAELMLKLAEDYEKSENERLHEVESKATVFIGIFSVTVTILMSLLKDFLPNAKTSLLNTVPVGVAILSIILLALAIFYLCLAIINSIKTLERDKFSVLGVFEILKAGSCPSTGSKSDLEEKDQNISENQKVHTEKNDKNDKAVSVIKESTVNNVKENNGIQNPLDLKKQEIARKKFLYTYKNQVIINRKVEYMNLAQKFFIHAVVVLLMMAVLLAGYMIWNKTGSYIINWLGSFAKLLHSSGGKSVTPSTP